MGAGKPTTTNIVTAILQHGEKILILKRSKKVRTMRMMWAGISGYIEDETPLERALKEIKEETGLTNDSVVLVHIGQPLEAVEPSMPWLTWIVHPFLFYSNTVLIKIDWEHEEYKWITPEEIVKYRTVPRLRDVVDLLFHNKSN